MNILVVGCGDVGSSLIQRLGSLGHDVSVVEEREEALRKLEEMSPPFHGMVVRGVPIDADVLRSAGIEDCDAVAAVAHDDNVNIMVAQMARLVFGIKIVFARIIDPATKKVYGSNFGFRTICDTNLATEALIIGMLPDECLIEKSMALGTSTVFYSYSMADETSIGKHLSQIEDTRPNRMTFALQRKSGNLVLATKADPTVEDGDKIIFAALAD